MKLLPAWYNALKANGFDEVKMPRDVATRWNSTYILIDFCVEHRTAIEALTSDQSNKLRACEIDDEKGEWELLTQLRDVLQVWRLSLSYLWASSAMVLVELER